MKTLFNEHTHKYDWILDTIWSKIVYVCGWIFVTLFALGFIKGFVNA